MQALQSGEVAELRGDRTGQAVPKQRNEVQVAEVAQFRRNRAGQTVFDEPQRLQLRELAKFRRNGTRKPVAPEIYLDDSPLVIRVDAAPVLEWCVRQPVSPAAPVVSARRIVQRFESIAIRTRPALETRAIVGGNRTEPVTKCGVRGGTYFRAGVGEFPERKLRQGEGQSAGEGYPRSVVPSAPSGGRDSEEDVPPGRSRSGPAPAPAPENRPEHRAIRSSPRCRAIRRSWSKPHRRWLHTATPAPPHRTRYRTIPGRRTPPATTRSRSESEVFEFRHETDLRGKGTSEVVRAEIQTRDARPLDPDTGPGRDRRISQPVPAVVPVRATG